MILFGYTCLFECKYMKIFRKFQINWGDFSITGRKRVRHFCVRISIVIVNVVKLSNYFLRFWGLGAILIQCLYINIFIYRHWTLIKAKRKNDFDTLTI